MQGTPSMLCGILEGRGVWGRMGICKGMTESLCCSLQTVTTLLIGYIPIQNKMFKKNSPLKKIKVFLFYVLPISCQVLLNIIRNIFYLF